MGYCTIGSWWLFELQTYWIYFASQNPLVFSAVVFRDFFSGMRPAPPTWFKVLPPPGIVPWFVTASLKRSLLNAFAGEKSVGYGKYFFYSQKINFRENRSYLRNSQKFLPQSPPPANRSHTGDWNYTYVSILS